MGQDFVDNGYTIQHISGYPVIQSYLFHGFFTSWGPIPQLCHGRIWNIQQCLESGCITIDQALGWKKNVGWVNKSMKVGMLKPFKKFKSLFKVHFSPFHPTYPSAGKKIAYTYFENFIFNWIKPSSKPESGSIKNSYSGPKHWNISKLLPHAKPRFNILLEMHGVTKIHPNF